MPGRLLEQTWHHNPTIYAPAKYQRACRYQAFVPDNLVDMPLSLDAPVAGIVSEAEHAIRSLNEPAGFLLAPLARLLLRTESIASSRIEGMQLGVRELARAEASGGASPTAKEVLANIDAMILAVDEAARMPAFGIRQITDIHARLMERAEHEHIAGQIRAQQNWIGGNDHNPCGADFIPPPPEQVEPLLVDLCAAINDVTLPPLVQAALVHAQFETIHPFHDGNGRTGRALIQVVLRRREVAPRYVPPISVVLAASKSRYLEGLTGFRGPDVRPWIEHFAAATAQAAHLATAYLKTVEELRQDWRERLGAHENAPRSGAAAWVVIDILPAHPIITVAAAAAATGRAKPPLYEAFEQLQAAGVLTPTSTSKRNQSWEPAGLLDVISRMETGQLPTVRPA